MTIRRIVRRVTVIDGVDIPTTVMATIDIALPNAAKLIPVSIGQNSVTYDVECIYGDGGGNTDISYSISSNLISVGEDIDEALPGITSMTGADTHVRDATNGRVVVNQLLVGV